MINDVTIEALVAELPEVYQPIFNHPELSVTTSRDCGDRWIYIEKIYWQLENELKRPLNVLDLGCAQGYFSLSLATCGATVLGIDYLNKNIAVCQALAKDNSKLKVKFEVGKIEEIIDNLTKNEYDLVLGLSVFHHIVYEHGLDWTKKLLEKLTSKITLGIFEVALADEPLYWAAAQAKEPRELLEGFSFVHQIANFPTHLSQINRPMYVVSSFYWILDEMIGQFCKVENNPHMYANNTHENTRQYFISEDKLVKLFLFKKQNRYELNQLEYYNEVTFLNQYPTIWKGIPKILHCEQNKVEAWIVRTMIKGKLLCDLIDQKELYNADQIIRDILDQVIALESVGLYHNDIRTWNVLVKDDNTACLIDYGAISKKELDCQWPYDKYLSFLTFIREVLGNKTIIPSFFRIDKFDISTLPEPYKKIFFNFFNLGPDEISFEKLKELLENFDLVSDYSAGITIYGQAIDNAIEITKNNLLFFEQQAKESNKKAELFSQRAEEAETRAEESNERVLYLERKVNEIEVRAENAEQHALELEHMVHEANIKTEEAETRAQEANERVGHLQQEVNAAQAQAQNAEQHALELEHRVHEANIKTEETDARAQEANERALYLEQKVNEVEVRAESAEQYYNMVINSRSWKFTKPLRYMGKFVRWFARGSYHWLTFSPTSRPRRVLKQKLILLKAYINTNPSLKNNVMQLLNHFPMLQARLKRVGQLHIDSSSFEDQPSSIKQNINNLQSSLSKNEEDLSLHVKENTNDMQIYEQLTPRAKEIYYQLKAVIEENRKSVQ